MSDITNWVLDPTHSEVQFKVKHLMAEIQMLKKA
jgi:polyisoprenoid-binding protein YceI